MIDDRIFQLCKQISESLAHNWTLEEMTEATGLSKSYFIKLFKTSTKMTPIAWLREVRLKKACELLEGDHEQICQIGRQVGMPNDSHFTRDFKKRFGKTPTAYRKNFHEEKQAKIFSGQK